VFREYEEEMEKEEKAAATASQASPADPITTTTTTTTNHPTTPNPTPAFHGRGGWMRAFFQGAYECNYFRLASESIEYFSRDRLP
jgi:hypothetical protein